MRKTTSRNYSNELKLRNGCGMAYTLGLISGRWKPVIFWRLVGSRLRYGELKKAIPDISERMLSAHLREMEVGGVIKRTVHPQVPPKVEYELTDLGDSLIEVFKPLCDWGKRHMKTAKETHSLAGPQESVSSGGRR